MAVLLRCPNCEKKYRWNAAVEDAPEFCPDPECGWDVSSKRADDDIPITFIKSARSKANDQVARQIMDGSEKRVELAAEAAGCSPADMSDLKITNLNDRRDSQIAAMPVQNAVTEQMDKLNQRGGSFGFSGQGAEWAAGIKDGSVTIDGKVLKGVAPRAGVSAIGKIHRQIGRG